MASQPEALSASVSLPAPDDTGQDSPATHGQARERTGASAPAVRERLEAALDASIDSCVRCKVCDTQIGAAMTVLGPLLERAEAAEAKLAAVAEHRNAACAALRIAETQARYPAGDEATAERYRAAREALEGTAAEAGQ